MLDILSDFLNDNTTPEVTASVADALTLFDRMGMDTVEQGYEETLMLDDETDVGGTLEAIVALTRSLLHQALLAHGVTISADATVSELNAIMKGILDLADYDNPVKILEVCANPVHAEELLADCLQLVTHEAAENLMTLIEAVDRKLLVNLAVEADKAFATIRSEDQETLRTLRIVKYKDFIAFAKLKQLKLAYLLSLGLDVGHPIQVYLNLLGPEFGEMEPEAIAYEFICMAFISSDAFENPQPAIRTHLDQYISSVDTMTKVDLFVSDLLLKYIAHVKI